MRSDNWRYGELGSYSIVEMGQSPPGSSCNAEQRGMPLLNGPTEFGSKYPTPKQWTTEPKRICRPGDLLFCVRGSTTGRMNWADQTYAIGRGLAAIRHVEGAEYQHFLKGAIDAGLEGLLQMATGSTFPNVSKPQILSLRSPIPPVPEQRSIAATLSCLDDKIELNNRMNKTLEEMAQALFKSWFVDFDPVKARWKAASPPAWTPRPLPCSLMSLRTANWG